MIQEHAHARFDLFISYIYTVKLWVCRHLDLSHPPDLQLPREPHEFKKTNFVISRNTVVNEHRHQFMAESVTADFRALKRRDVGII